MTSLRTKLDELERLIRGYHDPDPEVLAWLARMLVIRSSGFIEQTAKETCRSHVHSKSGGRVRSFALSWLERGRNPSPDNLLEIVGRFDSALYDDFSALLEDDDQRLRRELSFLVDRRNKIAHGLNEGVSRAKALDLKGVADEISDWFVLRFHPSSPDPPERRGSRTQ